MKISNLAASTIGLVIRELISGIILAFIGFQLFMILSSFFIPPSLANVSIILAFAFIAIITTLVVYYIEKSNKNYGSFLHSLLFSSLFIGVYATAVYLVSSGHFVPT
jgi:heme/copper-type cytochrome/quinol oxidase subunit 4